MTGDYGWWTDGHHNILKVPASSSGFLSSLQAEFPEELGIITLIHNALPAETIQFIMWIASLNSDSISFSLFYGVGSLAAHYCNLRWWIEKSFICHVILLSVRIWNIFPNALELSALSVHGGAGVHGIDMQYGGDRQEDGNENMSGIRPMTTTGVEETMAGGLLQ